jgi:small subunit ribosomal protein S9
MEGKTQQKDKKYIEAVGRRKTSVARVRVSEAARMSFSVNGKELEIYFPTRELQATVRDPFTKVEGMGKFSISAHITGGGIHSQAEAMRHGLSRVLVSMNEELRKELKGAGFLKRDPRAKERRKFGLKKARKAPQWSKR